MPVYWKDPSWNGNVLIPSLGFLLGTFKSLVALSMLSPLRLEEPWGATKTDTQCSTIIHERVIYDFDSSDTILKARSAY